MNEKRFETFISSLVEYRFQKLAPEMKWEEIKDAPKCRDVESKENRKQISLWVVCGAVVYTAQPILAIT
jgi:hypothetical protein